MANQVEEETSCRSVGIIGCGWLGKALAQALLKKGISVLATSSKLENVEKLNLEGIPSQQLSLPADSEQLVRQRVFNQQ
ncbi:MAG: NAD(P)-binding domain-containing protein, partial [Colwellia sp.]|nr:NAD(P)-binding domain-containing protein [Colwellia sp.]